MKNGFRQKAQPSKKQMMNDIGTQLRNVQMACRVLQIGMQQLGQSYQQMGADVNRLMGLVAHLQYKQEAAQQLSGLSAEAINAKADELRLKEYNEKSDKEDADLGYTVAETVESDSVVTVTSTCASKDREIFRSKFPLNNCGVPELQEKLLGKKVGDKVEVALNGEAHTVELLAIRKAPPKAAEPTDEGVVESTAGLQPTQDTQEQAAVAH